MKSRYTRPSDTRRTSAPDYETILENGCDLAIENTMIYHTPEVVEQLESVGVPVLIERSSYESDPLGRMEWLKLYGALVGKEDAACAAYDALLQDLQPVLAQEPAGGFAFWVRMSSTKRYVADVSHCRMLSASGTAARTTVVPETWIGPV